MTRRPVVGVVMIITAAIVLAASWCVSGEIFASCNPSLQTCSGSYGVNEVFFGIGGNPDCSTQTSAHYCVKSSTGETTVGNSTNSGSGHQIQAGFNTDRNPSLTLVVNNPNANLGYLSTGSTATTTATFSVQTYLAGSYIVQTVGNPPTSSGPSPYQLTPITTVGGGASAAGTEQFGMNLVDTVPHCDVSGFCNYPSGITFGSGYGTASKYYYHNGDTILSSNSSSGQTDYTITYIFNISSGTPDGTYTFNQSIVATSMY